MRVLQTEISPGLQHPFAVLKKKGKSFSSVLHAHPELELIWVRRGRGQRIIGHQIGSFEPGEMILLGSGLAHRWVYDESSAREAQSIVVYFHPGLLNNVFYDMIAAAPLRELLQEAAQQGIRIVGATRQKMEGRLEKLSRLTGLAQCLGILELLADLSTHRDDWQWPVSGVRDAGIRHQLADDRLQAVYKYVAENYARDISLADAATLAHLSETAFCRVFKQRTQTHFVAYLNEVRVQRACECLQESNESVSQIAVRCGFRSLSNFNKCFRKARGMSPLQYRSQYLRMV